MFGRVGSLLRRPRVLAAGALIYVSGSVLALIALRRGDNEPDSNGLVDMESAQDAHRCCERRFDSLARSYDEKIDRDEQSNGILDFRRKLCSHAKGDVLEVAGGSGRNLEFLNSNHLESLVVSDLSPKMMHVAIEKIKNNPKCSYLRRIPIRCDWDVRAESLPYADETFDTVVDTFGLCSFYDPVKALQEMARVCKRDGRILLLEHGRNPAIPEIYRDPDAQDAQAPATADNLSLQSSFTLLDSFVTPSIGSESRTISLWERLSAPFINLKLDKTAVSHAQTWGCWYNRDIQGIVLASGLRIVYEESAHFGTTRIYILERPSDSSLS